VDCDPFRLRRSLARSSAGGRRPHSPPLAPPHSLRSRGGGVFSLPTRCAGGEGEGGRFTPRKWASRSARRSASERSVRLIVIHFACGAHLRVRLPEADDHIPLP